MRIDEIRNQLAGVNQQMETVREKGVALSKDENSTTAQLTAVKDELENLKMRRDVLADALADATDPEKMQPETLKALDNVKSVGGKFKSFADFCDVVRKAGDKVNPRIDTRLAEYMSIRDAASGANITTDADGGYLIPPDYAEGLGKVAMDQAVIFPGVTKIPVAGNRLVRNLLKQSSMKDTVRTENSEVYGRNGGLIGYWKAEAAQLTKTYFIFEQQEIQLEKLTGLSYATEEMLEDAPALAAYLQQGFAEEFAFQIDNAILNGRGHSTYYEPTGVLASSNALVTVAKESGQAASTVVAENIIKMYNAMPARNRANAVWYINQDVEPQLLKMVLNTGSMASTGESAVEELTGSFGQLIYLPPGGLTNKPAGTLMGRPVVPIEQCAGLGTKGDIVFMDPSQYIWISKGGIQADTSIHLRFDYDEMAFRFTYRCGGACGWKNAVQAYKSTTSRSPYVTLAARA